MQKNVFQHWINTLFFIVLTAAILYTARSFLIPLTLAGLLALVLIPFCRWMESKKLNRMLASLIAVAGFAIFVAGILLLLGWQLSDIGEDFSRIKDSITRQVQKVQQYISSSIGITKEKQDELIKEQSNKSSSEAGKAVPAIMSALLGFAADAILMLVYMFLFLYLRAHLKNFVLKLQKTTENRQKANSIMEKAGKVVQQYLGGLGAMIVMLWIMYGIGFSIAGVKYAIFFAVLCGLLEIVPFVGNLTGTTLTVLMVLAQGGSGGMLIGVIVTYLVVQFIQTYILEPFIVGEKVNINPLFTIIALVLGELIWGIAGMVMAIPVTGLIKIICGHIEPLHSYSYLLGNAEKEHGKRTNKGK